MDTRAARAQIRQEWEQEAKEDEQQEREIEAGLQKWKLGTSLLGFAFAGVCAALVPFLAGHSLHAYWDTVGQKILLLDTCLFFPFLLVAANCLIEWNYFRAIKRINRKFAPPNLKYRKT